MLAAGFSSSSVAGTADGRGPRGPTCIKNTQLFCLNARDGPITKTPAALGLNSRRW